MTPDAPATAQAHDAPAQQLTAERGQSGAEARNGGPPVPAAPSAGPVPELSTPADLRRLTTRPSSARVCNWFLRGKDNYPVDADLARQLLDAAAFLRHAAAINRAYAKSTIAFLVRRGITQFIDLGCGLPVYPALYETAAGLLPEGTGVTVAYVDHDPIVMAHTSALLTPAPPHRTVHVRADLAHPEQILTDPTLLNALDLSQPVGLLAHAVLHELPDHQAYPTLQAFTRSLPPGSALSLTHPTADLRPTPMNTVAALSARAGLTPFFRSRDQIGHLFGGWNVLGPGLTETAHWHPGNTAAAYPAGTSAAYAAIALNP
ncbi:SAM-dependent methyltransferase [Streptomyces sp. NPDC097610]|uniref:SAM-dependent methyltransferase n=1 Tax=Streptomyces sp. NPDC097610 TaxID=3157227 RepID=UPI003320C555